MEPAANENYGSRKESINEAGGFSKSLVNNKSLPLIHVSK
jgi:hypothetical protein